jgi:hypothetical protein
MGDTAPPPHDADSTAQSTSVASGAKASARRFNLCDANFASMAVVINPKSAIQSNGVQWFAGGGVHGPRGGASDGAVVTRLNVAAAFADPFSATDGGATEQVELLGAPEQLSATDPVKPLNGVSRKS